MSSMLVGPAVAIAVVIGASVAAAGCAAPRSTDLNARATDEWVRSYPLTPGGAVRLVNPRGSITLEGTDGSTVDVRVVRTVHALSEAAAREVLPRLAITETVTADQVTVESQRLGGMVVGIRIEEVFHVRLPRGVKVQTRSDRGDSRASGLSGVLTASVANANLILEDHAGGLQATVVNGTATVGFAAFGDAGATVRSTNGNIVLVLPPTAKANLQATVRNGRVNIVDLPFERTEDTPRNVTRGRINGGGAPLELTATNGRIRVASPTAPLDAEPAAMPGAQR